jgi:hypothetical protein
MATKKKDPIVGLEWEEIGEYGYNRAKVPGGWLVECVEDIPGGDRAVTVAMVYVPDSDHEWLLK